MVHEVRGEGKNGSAVVPQFRSAIEVSAGCWNQARPFHNAEQIQSSTGPSLEIKEELKGLLHLF
jgi:hypothetical protein